MNKLCIPIFLLLLVGGCASEQIREDAGDYDMQQYLVATGSADTEEKAKQRARSNLAKIFAVEIREDSSDYSSYRSSAEKGSKKQSRSWQVDRSISTYTNRVLEGVQIASVEQDEKSRQYRAVAILSRDQAGRFLGDQIEQMDQHVRTLMSDAGNTKDKISRLRLLYRALEKQKQRDSLQKALVVVDTKGKGKPSPVSFWEIEEQLNQTLASIRFRVSARPNAQLDLQALLNAAIANNGARVAQNADYWLQSEIEVHDMGKIQGWNWYKALLTLKISQVSGRTLVAKKVTVKVAALDAPSAKIKLQKKLQSYTEQVLHDMILGKKAPR